MKKRFNSKDAESLSRQNEIKFNGAIVRHHGTNITIFPPQHIEKLRSLDRFDFTPKLFVTERARGAYIAAVCPPGCTYGFSKLSKATAPDENDVKFLNNAISSCKELRKSGLRFVQLKNATFCFAVVVDARFATNNDLTSQLGYLIILIHNDGNTNIVLYGTIKSRGVTRSALAAELFAMTHGFDVTSTLCLAVNGIFG